MVLFAVHEVIEELRKSSVPASSPPELNDEVIGPEVGERSLGIGLVGAGAIVRAGHLPAYRQAGFRVVAITDLDERRALTMAADFEIEGVHPDVAALLANPAVDVVDIAVTPSAQAGIVEAAIAAGKHVLAQKPFHTDLGVAAALVRQADVANVRVAVNQQMRWDQVIRSNKTLAESGFFGVLTGASFDVHVMTDWSMWPWLLVQDRLEYFFHSIHYIDAVRYLFGEPRSVLARTARYPRQAAVGETRTFTILEFDDDVVVTVLADHNNWSNQPRAIVRCTGTDGQSEGTLGALSDYPTGGPDTFAYWSRTTWPDHRVDRSFTQRWIPDAFVGPMAELQQAIADDREPSISARDNLLTLQVVHAAYRSAELGCRVPLDEIQIPAGSA